MLRKFIEQLQRLEQSEGSDALVYLWQPSGGVVLHGASGSGDGAVIIVPRTLAAEYPDAGLNKEN